MGKSDAALKSDVLNELMWDARVKETDVGVEVHSGVVTLTGTVDSWALRLGAQEAAHRVAGVLDVANDIHVKLPGSSECNDTDIAKAIRHALHWDVLVPDQRIQSTVSNGVVTLEGTVDTWSAFDDAARCVRNLRGVVEVKNLLSVEPPAPHLSVTDLRSSIEGALQRHAEHAAKRVHLSLAKDKVVLSGDVPTYADWRVIEGAVRGTPGVRTVDNQLRVTPP
jgi:osmotically-inducible protein OsmY